MSTVHQNYRILEETKLTRCCNIGLEGLNLELSKHERRPIRLIVMVLKDDKDTAQQTYQFHVVLDPRATDERLQQIRWWIGQHKGLRECYVPKDSTKAAQSSFVEWRTWLFTNAAQKGRRIYSAMQHLQVHLVDPARELEFELRRWADPGSDKTTKRASAKLAVGFLGVLTVQGESPWSPDRCRRMHCFRQQGDAEVSDNSIAAVKQLFQKIHKKQGIVERRWTEQRSWEWLRESEDGKSSVWVPYS